LLVTALALLVPRPAWAQPEPDAKTPSGEPDKPTAVLLFEQGLADMKAGKYATGCPALAESYRLDPLPGALFTVAECERKWGKLASARTRYQQYLSQVKRMSPQEKSRQGQRPEVAEGALDDLQAQVPKLTILLADDVPDTAIVKRDGDLVAPRQLGRPIPLDPGTHTLTLDVPGRDVVRETVALEAGRDVSVTLKLSTKKPVPPEPPPPPPDEGMGPMRLAAYIVGGVGIAGVIAGVVSGAIAINRAEEIEDNCVELVCNPTGISKVETVREAGTTSTISFAIGGAGVAVGLLLWFLSEPEDPADTGLLVTPDGVGLRW
jgi:hypothetical protein